jgi:putative DNA-invertase from lambdoid prophage Rac
VATSEARLRSEPARRFRERNSVLYRLAHWPIWIFVFFIAPGPLTFDLFERGFDQRMALWLGAVLLATGIAGLRGSLPGVEPKPYILHFTEDKPNPLYRRICYTTAWGDLIGFAVLNLVGLTYAVATGHWHQRELRESLIAAARRREVDVVLVWRLDRWGRSVADLVSTLQELQHLGVGFVSLTEALDLTTPAGRAMAGLLAVFAEFERDILRERVRAGLAHARQQGKQLGRPPSVVHNAAEVRRLCRQGISKSEIARRLQIGRTSVRRLLAPKKS